MTAGRTRTIAAATLVAALAVIAAVTAPPQAPPLRTYASTAYDADGYRAWAALLEREGVTTARFELRPIELDRQLDTLISAQPPLAAADPQSRTAADIGALADWVRAGGRLVYAGRFPGLGEAERRLLHLPIVLPNVGRRGPLGGPLAAEVRTLPALGTDRMLFVEQAGRSLLSDRNGDIAAAYPLGRGEVIAVVDPVIFANAGIARGDAGRLAYLVGRPRRGAGVVAFDDGLHGSLIDRPWYRALTVPERVALAIAALAALLALIASVLPGPAPMRLRAPREPGSVEFIDALAALYERTGARAAVRAILVDGALRAAARNAGLAGESSPDVLLARLSERGDGEPVRRLLAARDAPLASDAQLLATAKLAFLVRKDLTDGRNGDRRRSAFAGGTRTGRRG